MIPGTPVLNQQNPLTGLLLAFGLTALVIVVAGLAIGLGFWLVLRRQRDGGTRWAETAQALGLGLDAASRIELSSALDGATTARPMRGTWGGRDAAVWVSRERYSSRTTGWKRYVFHTCCSVGIRGPRGPAFSIVPRKALDGVLGAAGFPTGLASFDDRFRVAGPSPAEVLAMLSARAPDGVSLAERFVRLSARGWSLAADQDAVVARRRGVTVDVSAIRTALGVLSDLASGMER
jgi:hypothetical protein